MSSLYDSFTWTDEHRRTNAERILNNNSDKDDPVRFVRHIGFEKVVMIGTIIFSNNTKMICGEITPEYFLSEEHVIEIKKYPNLKIIFMMREPYSRAVSNIKMKFFKRLDNSSGPKVIKAFVSEALNDWDHIERGNYEKIISTWYKVFGQERCLFILLAEIYSYPVGVIKHISDFLNVEINVTNINIESKVHAGHEVFIDKEDKKLINLSQEKNILWFDENHKHFKIKV